MKDFQPSLGVPLNCVINRSHENKPIVHSWVSNSQALSVLRHQEILPGKLPTCINNVFPERNESSQFNFYPRLSYAIEVVFLWNPMLCYCTLMLNKMFLSQLTKPGKIWVSLCVISSSHHSSLSLSYPLFSSPHSFPPSVSISIHLLICHLLPQSPNSYAFPSLLQPPFIFCFTPSEPQAPSRLSLPKAFKYKE